jgi:hypothetical protein
MFRQEQTEQFLNYAFQLLNSHFKSARNPSCTNLAYSLGDSVGGTENLLAFRERVGCRENDFALGVFEQQGSIC